MNESKVSLESFRTRLCFQSIMADSEQCVGDEVPDIRWEDPIIKGIQSEFDSLGGRTGETKVPDKVVEGFIHELFRKGVVTSVKGLTTVKPTESIYDCGNARIIRELAHKCHTLEMEKVSKSSVNAQTEESLPKLKQQAEKPAAEATGRLTRSRAKEAGLTHVTRDLTGGVETVPVGMNKAESIRSLTSVPSFNQLWEEESEGSGRKSHPSETRVPLVNVESSGLAASVNLPDEQKQMSIPDRSTGNVTLSVLGGVQNPTHPIAMEFSPHSLGNTPGREMIPGEVPNHRVSQGSRSTSFGGQDLLWDHTGMGHGSPFDNTRFRTQTRSTGLQLHEVPPVSLSVTMHSEPESHHSGDPLSTEMQAKASTGVNRSSVEPNLGSGGLMFGNTQHPSGELDSRRSHMDDGSDDDDRKTASVVGQSEGQNQSSLGASDN